MSDLRLMIGSALVLGASEDPSRYSNLAVRRLREHGVPVVAIGRRAGRIGDVEIQTGIPDGVDIDTVVLYLSAVNQQPWIEALIALRPRRIIFNPGTANPALSNALIQEGVEVEDSCALVMLATGQY